MSQPRYRREGLGWDNPSSVWWDPYSPGVVFILFPLDLVPVVIRLEALLNDQVDWKCVLTQRVSEAGPGTFGEGGLKPPFEGGLSTPLSPYKVPSLPPTPAEGTEA